MMAELEREYYYPQWDEFSTWAERPLREEEGSYSKAT